MGKINRGVRRIGGARRLACCISEWNGGAELDPRPDCCPGVRVVLGQVSARRRAAKSERSVVALSTRCSYRQSPEANLNDETVILSRRLAGDRSRCETIIGKGGADLCRRHPRDRQQIGLERSIAGSQVNLEGKE